MLLFIIKDHKFYEQMILLREKKCHSILLQFLLYHFKEDENNKMMIEKKEIFSLPFLIK